MPNNALNGPGGELVVEYVPEGRIAPWVVPAEMGLGMCDGEECERSDSEDPSDWNMCPVVSFQVVGGVGPEGEVYMSLCPDCLQKDDAVTLSFR